MSEDPTRYRAGRRLPEGVIIITHPDGRQEAMHRDRAKRLGIKTEVERRAADAVTTTAPATTAKPAIRLPRDRTPNKTEARFMALAKLKWPEARVCYESLTLILPSGTRYTPDVTVWDGPTLLCIAEVKVAFIHNSRSVHAFKEARSAFAYWPWMFAQWKNNEWRIEG